MLSKIRTICGLALIIFVAQMCSTVEKTATNNVSKVVNPAFKSFNVDYDQKLLNASESHSLTFGNGSKVNVPADCFVDEQGKPVAGNVDLQYREIHTASQIIASGISMHYDSAGIPIDFQTAGMFEIKAFVNGKPVFVAQNKSVNVQFASAVTGNDYNFYYLDTVKNNWTFLGTNQGADNSTQKAEVARIEQEIKEMQPPVLPTAYNPSDYTFDLDINYSRYPELKELNGIVWQYAGLTAESDPKNNPELAKEKWNEIQLKASNRAGVYSLHLRNSTKTFNTFVKPVLQGKSLKAAQAMIEKRMAAYNQMVENKRRELDRARQESMLVRAFNVNKMGVYNWDKKFEAQNRVTFAADFDFGQKINLDVNPITVYLISGDNRTVVYYPTYTWSSFTYYPDQNNKLVAVLPGDKVAVFTNEDFKKIDYKALKTEKSSKFKFMLRPLDAKVGGIENLDKVIADL